MEEVKQLLKAGTAVVADVFDTLSLLPPVLDTNLFSVKGQGEGFVGSAYTITGETQEWSTGGDPTSSGPLTRCPAAWLPFGLVTISKGVCCFGDLLASAMQARGCIGVVVDGGIRDVAFLRNMSLPVVARYRTPAQAIGRWKVTGREIPVQVRGGLQDWVTVNPGDTVVADDDGVIVVPQAILGKVIEQVAEWAGTENNSHREIQNGLPLRRRCKNTAICKQQRIRHRLAVGPKRTRPGKTHSSYRAFSVLAGVPAVCRLSQSAIRRATSKLFFSIIIMWPLPWMP